MIEKLKLILWDIFVRPRKCVCGHRLDKHYRGSFAENLNAWGETVCLDGCSCRGFTYKHRPHWRTHV